MRVYTQREGIFGNSFDNKLNHITHLIDRNDNIVRRANLADKAYGFQTVTAHRPDTLIRLQHVDSACSLADIARLLHLHVQLILIEGFNRDDNINAILNMRRTGKLQIFRGRAHIGIIHIFYTRRLNTCFYQLRHHANSSHRIVENRQHINFIRRQRLQLQRYLRNNTQRTLTANNQLLHAIAGAALFQRRAKVDNIAIGRNNLHGINLIARYAVTHSLDTACIRRQVAADLAAVAARRIACIKQILGLRRSLNIQRAHTSLRHHVQAFLIQLDDFVQALHQKHHAALIGNRAVHDARTAAAHCQRNEVPVAQLHHTGDLLCIGRQHHNVRQMKAALVCLLIRLIAVQRSCISFDVAFTKQHFQFIYKFRSYGIIITHFFSFLYTFYKADEKVPEASNRHRRRTQGTPRWLL